MGAARLAELLGEHEPGVPYYRSLARRLQLLIDDGRLAVGTRIPSERDLAAALHRSRATVVAAYDVLRDTGHLRSRRGAGTIAAVPRRSVSGVIDLAHAVPPPIEGLGDLVDRAMSQLDRAMASPGFDMLGDPVLRSRIADHYGSRGLPTTSQQVLVTLGGQHAIGTLARALVRPGDRVLMETPSYPHAYDAFLAVGARLVTSPVGAHGWDGDHLVDTISRVRPVLAYLAPDFQNPTGASMPPDLRRAVVQAAARAGSAIVVDETTALLDIDRGWNDGPVARHATSTGADVVTIGSLSKSVWGGLRLGWIRATARTIESLARRRPAFDLGTPMLEQLVAAEVLPELPQLLPHRAAQLHAGRDHLVGQLTELLPEWAVPVPRGGLSLWVGLDRPLSTSLAVLSQTRGMLVSAGPRFTADGTHERYVRLPYTEPPDKLTRAAAMLAELWATLESSAPGLVPNEPPTVV
jgi:DNA-binding transcriptional MocR family regulator